MIQVIPRPTNTTLVQCPACGHEINVHHAARVTEPAGCIADECRWTPNDIAWDLVIGGLTGGHRG